MEMKIDFERVIQDSQEFGSTDEHMVSRVYFSLMVNGQEHQGLYAHIKQTVGGEYETDGIEVSPPFYYGGPMDYTIFRDAVETYYRGLVGSQGRGGGLGGGATGVRMRDNLFVIPATFHIFKQEKFEDKTILVDGKTFIDCDFKNCTMQYGGGSGTVFDANRFDGYRWQFVGPALMTLGFMRSLYHGGFSTVIDEIVDSIRKTETK